MIRLRAVFNSEDLAAYASTSLPSFEQVEQDLTSFWESLGDRSFTADITVARAEDETGQAYEDFRAQAVGATRMKGERWVLTSAGFMVSLDSIIDVMEASYAELGL